MLGRTAAQRPARPPAADAAAAATGRGSRRDRRRSLAACAVLAVALHVAFLDAVGDSAIGVAEPAGPPMSVRAIAAQPAPEPAAEAVVMALPPPPAAPPPKPRPQRRLRESKLPASGPVPSATEASASSAPMQVAAVPAPEPAADPGATAVVAADPAALEPEPGATAASAAASSGAAPASAGAATPPPPVYRTRLPPAATLHYQVRRGSLRGDGEIRWQPGEDGYRLVLEARISGLMLLRQSSEGAIDSHGIAPVRFLDQRARRAAQAANFVRDAGRVTFSGSGNEAPLLAGGQDRLSWMIQLAGIAAADPALLADGGQIAMSVVGARGDASVWTFRSAGREEIATPSGPVAAVKLVRQGRSAYDTTAEIWLDPGRSYLPAQASLRNNAGATEYELLLERIDPVP